MFRRFSAFALLALISACGGKTDDNEGSGSARQLGGDADITPPTSPPSNAPTTPGNSSSSSSGAVQPSGPCAGQGSYVQFNFEKEIDPAFSVANLGAFSIETTTPITGGGSLRAKAPGNEAPAYVAYNLAGTCAAMVKFRVRADADFIDGGSGAIVQAYARSRAFTILLGSNGALQLAQEATFGGSVPGNGMNVGATIGTLVANQVSVIYLEVDLAANRGRVMVDDKETPITFMLPEGTLSEPAAFNGILLGPRLPRFAASPKGIVWMDDVSFQ